MKMEDKMQKNIRLTSLAKSSGCAAKIEPNLLNKALDELSYKDKIMDDRLLVGFESSDDACVYRIDDENAIVSTLDFFTPIVDDPYIFGEIAATNALSDIYAMGAKPIFALNIVCFPVNLDMKILSKILEGGLKKVNEAGANLVGGHSIKDDVPKYGLSCTGIVNLNKITKNNKVEKNQSLFLTKPIGVGIINTAIKGGLAAKSEIDYAVKSMTKLNKYPEDMIDKFNIRAMTDVTGFSLIGHLNEMVNNTEFSAFLETTKIPLIGGSLDYVKMGVIPAGLYKNRNYYEKYSSVLYEEIKDSPVYDVIFDPQTSGGLLIAVDEEKEVEFEKYLRENDFLSSAKIGKIIPKQEKNIIIG